MNKLLILLSLAVLFALAPSHAHAQSSISDKITESLDAMVNYTPPGVHETNRRTVVSGGSLTVKMQTGSVEGFAFRPPSISTGCGGVDAFFGAFSMISKDVLVQALRGIVTGALQYAFRIALKVLCQSCEQIMSEIASTLQAANRWLGDMCNTTLNFLEGKYPSENVAAKARAENANVQQGTTEDTASSKKWGSFRSAMEDFRNASPDADAAVKANFPEYGNQLYMLMQAAEDTTFYWLGDKSQFYEEMISLVGTVIVCSAGDDGCPLPSSEADTVHAEQDGAVTKNHYRPVLSFEYLVSGNTMAANDDGTARPGAIWECLSHGGDIPCKGMRPGTLDGYVSVTERMRRAFLGYGTNPGIINKLHDSPTAALTTEEERWLLAGGSMVGMVLDLAIKDRGSAIGWVEDYGEVLAAEFTFNMVIEFLTKLRQAAANKPTTTLSTQMDLIDVAFADARADYMKIQARAQGRGIAFDAYRARAATLSGRY